MALNHIIDVIRSESPAVGDGSTTQAGTTDKGEGMNESGGNYDISIIRPQVCDGEIAIRGAGMPDGRLRRIRKGLRTLNTLELMAANIYRFQIKGRDRELDRCLVAAMLNEMTHYQDFQVKLYEYGFRPSILRWAFWLVGFAMGFASRLIGPKAILKVGIWVETKAVHHYGELLDTIEWDEDTRKIIEKDQADEYGHIDRWHELLEANQQ